MHVLIVDHYDDVNVNHVFSQELHALFKLVKEDVNVHTLLVTHPESMTPWRKGALETLVPSIVYFVHPNVKYDRIVTLDTSAWVMDAWSFVPYPPNEAMIELSARLRGNTMLSKSHSLQNKIAIVQRKSDRIMYDYDTGVRLEIALRDIIGKSNMFLIVVEFEDMTYDEHVHALRDVSVIVSAHGAGNTNLILTGADLIEVTFRSCWTCDPVCDRHASGTLSVHEPCGPLKDTLTFRPYYHKADYHNLAKLLGREYVEIPAITIDRSNISSNRNPIHCDKMYVRAKDVMAQLVRRKSDQRESKCRRLL